ncbi:MAG: alanine racemase [Candidatus Omnitrophica bacterium]|jgi:alanine racemase|nr:alanine racemase [Candidatus Omnitrophota bacterium]
MFRPLWIEIDLKALRENFNSIRKSVGSNVKIIATIKQQAYGHGLIPIARELSFLGVDCFGVGSLEEAVALRENGFKERILTISAILPDYVGEILRHKVTPTIADLNFAKRLNKAAAKENTKVPVHVEIDTGMGRLGLYCKEAYGFIHELKYLKALNMEGVYTHLPAADTDPDFTNSQISVFNKFISRLKKEGITFKYQHCANSLGVVHYPHSHFNVVRPGLILYGINPSSENTLNLKPVLSLKSKIIFIKKIKSGMSVSYGRTFVAAESTNIATISVGYADGYPWSLSNSAKTIIGDNFFNLVGRVCMDHVMMDLGSNSDIKVAEEVVLIGEKNGLKITTEEVASWAKTIPYEIVSRLSSRIPRLYKNANEKQLNFLKNQF